MYPHMVNRLASLEARDRDITAEIRRTADQAEGRAFSEAEQRNVDRLQAELDEVRSTKAEIIKQAQGNAEAAEARMKFDRVINGTAGEARMDESLPADLGFRNLPEANGYNAGDLGAHVRSILRGEVRAQGEGTASAGGYLVPTPLAAGVLDIARNKARVMQAGARIVPMSSETLKVAKVTQDATPTWRNEFAAITEGSMTFGAVTFTARSLGVLVRASMELVEDAPEFGSTVERALGAAFGVEFDRVAVTGSGVAPEPQGIIGAPGVAVTNLGLGATLDHDHLIDGVAAVRGRNFDPSAVLLTDAVEASLAKTKDTAGNYVSAPSYIEKAERLATPQVDAAKVIVGDFSELLLGVRTSFRIMPLRERYADTGEVAFIGWMRADVQIARADAFQVLDLNAA